MKAMQGDKDCSEIVKTLIHLRKARCQDFPHEIFDEYAWNILLELFVAHSHNETVSISEISARAGATETAGRRWIEHLVVAEQIEPTVDMQDIRMTAEAIKAMRTYIDRVHAMGVERINDLR